MSTVAEIATIANKLIANAPTQQIRPAAIHDNGGVMREQAEPLAAGPERSIISAPFEKFIDMVCDTERTWQSE
jgi:hypothetical protein